MRAKLRPQTWYLTAAFHFLNAFGELTATSLTSKAGETGLLASLCGVACCVSRLLKKSLSLVPSFISLICFYKQC